MELEVTSPFPTLIGRLHVPDADTINQDLAAIIVAEEKEYRSLGRSNVGGWHSRPDFLLRPEPAVAGLTTWITWAVRKMIEASAGADQKDLQEQAKHGVKYMRYWVDEKAGKVFCLVEAPNKEAAHTVHRNAHGLVADEIYEVHEGS